MAKMPNTTAQSINPLTSKYHMSRQRIPQSLKPTLLKTNKVELTVQNQPHTQMSIQQNITTHKESVANIPRSLIKTKKSQISKSHTDPLVTSLSRLTMSTRNSSPGLPAHV
ncbi:hypothetical protein Dimus_039057 [Dionaea muscipula]